MLNLYLTVDTELSPGLFRRLGPNSAEEIFDRSIRCTSKDGEVGVDYQLKILERYGLKATFFVDPMPALVLGDEIIKRIVEPILLCGHDVQLHLHTEWLDFCPSSVLGGRRGRNLKEFSLQDQTALISLAAEILQRTGVEKIVAFRAGNYGASNETLVALQKNGIYYDSSSCPGFEGSACSIDLPGVRQDPVLINGVVEVPISAIEGVGGSRRHAQITALSAAELIDAIRHARDQGRNTFTIVSHSFELMSRDRTRKNEILKLRFESFCRQLAQINGVRMATYSDLPPLEKSDSAAHELLPHRFYRTVPRMIEQLISNVMYGRF